jgi:GNAT superfamily N-acetyltransferase
MAITTHPLTPDRWPDLEAVFGERGAVDGCWCMWFRQSSDEYSKGRGDSNRAALRSIVEGGPPPGIVAYVDGRPAGWCAVAPREEYPRVLRSRLTKPRDDVAAWSIVCFFTHRSARGQGLTAALLDAAIALAASHGATCLEAYPIDPSGKIDPGNAFHGLRGTFAAAGFKEIERRNATRPIMRLELPRKPA